MQTGRVRPLDSGAWSPGEREPKIVCPPIFGAALRKHYVNTGKDVNNIVDTPRVVLDSGYMLYCPACGSAGPFEIDLPTLDSEIRMAFLSGNDPLLETMYHQVRDSIVTAAIVTFDDAGRMVTITQCNNVSLEPLIDICEKADMFFGYEFVKCQNCDSGRITVLHNGQMDSDELGLEGILFQFTDNETGYDENRNPIITRDGIMNWCIECYNFNYFRAAAADSNNADILHYPGSLCVHCDVADGFCPIALDLYNFDITPGEIMLLAIEHGKWPQTDDEQDSIAQEHTVINHDQEELCL